MNFETIISQVDEHNEVNLLLVDKFKPKNIIFLVNNIDKIDLSELKVNYNKIFKDTNIIFEGIEQGNFKLIKDSISKYNNVLINLFGGDRINSFIMFKIACDLNIQSIYVDLKAKKRYVFSENMKVINKQLKDVSIDDIVKASGAEIISDSTCLCNKKDIIEICNIILKNIKIWHTYKQKLYDNNIFIHNYKDTDTLKINKKMLNKEEGKLVTRSLVYLKNRNCLSYSENNNEVIVNFKNDYIKGFLFKSGTWLEVVTYMIMNSISEVDEVRSGVLFSWGDLAKDVKNELDVVAVKDSVLICVSCKDSEKYDEDALNELNVYSEKLGGQDVIKILVATKYPKKVTVGKRAEEMGIHLIILENNIKCLKEKISNIIV